jgi:hypothetical protein
MASWFQEPKIISRWASILTASFNAPPVFQSATIASGQSLSSAVPTNGMMPQLLILPAAWDDSHLSFQVAFDGENFVEPADAVTFVSMILPNAGRANTSLYLVNAWFGRCTALKIRSGSLASPTTQSADRILQVGLMNWLAG